MVFRLETYEECNSTVHSNGRKFLYNSIVLDVNSLLVKYYMPLAHINKVIKLLKFKSAINLQCFLMGGAIERYHSFVTSFGRALSIAPLIRNSAKFITDLNFKAL